MKDLKYQAIVLLYPDGVVESVPIMKGMKDHIDYYRWLLEHSQKFANIVYHFPKKINFKKDWDVVERMLALANVISIRNGNVRDVLEDKSLIDSENSFWFSIYFPEIIEGNIAFSNLKQIRKENMKEDFHYGRYDSKSIQFVSVESNIIEEIENKEEEIKR